MPNIQNYNVEGMVNGSGSNILVQFMRVGNENIQYTASYAIYIMIAVVIFLALKTRGTTNLDSFAATMFVMFVLTLIMFPLGIVNGFLLIFTIAMLSISIFLLFVTN